VGRSASGSSGDFNSDGHDTDQQSPATLRAFTDKAAIDKTASSESKAKNRGFFDTLDWQDTATSAAAAAAASAVRNKKPDRVQQMAAFEAASTSLDEAFADFSAHRIASNTDVADVEPQPIVDRSNAETATADLLSGSAWNSDDAAKDLFDVGPLEQTNFDLLVGSGTVGNTNGNSSSGLDLFNNEQPFVADFGTELSNNPFTVQDTVTSSDNAALDDMAANLFGTFDPFTNAPVDEKPASSSSTQPKADGQTDDFLEYLESTSASKDDGPDLMSGWNASNILAGVSVNMPRASSRPDFGSSGGIAQANVPRASSSQNMASSSFVMANGSSKSSKAADPFADIGEYLATAAV